MTNAVRSLLILLFLLTSLATHASGPFQTLRTTAFDSLLAEKWVADSAVTHENTRLVASGLALLLGPFGAHRLYLGTTTKVAVIYGLTFGGFGILALIDLGHLVFSKDLTPYRNNDLVFMWGPKPEATPP